MGMGRSTTSAARAVVPRTVGAVVCVLALMAGTSQHALAESSWSFVPGGNVNGTYVRVSAVSAYSPTDAWAAGYRRVQLGSGTGYEPFTEHWNGSVWAVSYPVTPILVPTNVDDVLNGIAELGPHDVWTVGFQATTKGFAPLVEHWNGSAWSVVRTPTVGSMNHAYLLSVDARASNDVWAVGSYNVPDPRLGYTSHVLAEHWDGRVWSVVPTPAQAGELYSVSEYASNNVWATGTNGGALMEHWDGSNWAVIPSPSAVYAPNPSHPLNSLMTSINVASPSDVWAAGYSYGYAVPEQTLTEHWNGRKWSIVSSPSPGDNAALFGIAAKPCSSVDPLGVVCTGAEAWAVGFSESVGPRGGALDNPLIERWDGNKWQVTPVNSPQPDQSYFTAVSRAPGTTSLLGVGNVTQGSIPGLFAVNR